MHVSGSVTQRLSLIFSFIVLFSGIAGLGYQMAWSKMLAVALGHEIIAILAVIAAFFVGLALGAFILNNVIKRSAVPQRWYAICEFIIGSWSLILIIIIPEFNQFVANLIGSQPTPIWHWLIAFSSTLFLLLPSTFCMGATLPAIEKVFDGLLNKPEKVAWLYGLNTFGAMVGALFATFWLIPNFGLSNTLVVFSAINILCSVSMLLVWQRKSALVNKAPPRSLVFIGNKHLLFSLFVCGWLGLGFEVLIIRALSQILENTVYTFAAVLSVYLLGTGLGAAFYQKWVTRNDAVLYLKNWYSRRFFLLSVTALSCLLGSLALWLGEPVYKGIINLLGYGSFSAIIAELAVAMLVLLVPTVSMGMLFSHLIKPTVSGPGLGLSLGINTLGCAIAPLSFGILILPWLGSLTSLLLVSLCYLCLIPFSGASSAHLSTEFKRKILLVGTPIVLSIIFVLLPLSNNYISSKGQNQQLYYQEGIMAAIEVSQDNTGNKHLSINNHYTMGGTASRFSDHRQTHLPFLLHGDPKNALYLGLGTGITMNAAQYYPSTQVTGVELIPELLSVFPEFGVNLDSDDWQLKPQLLSADARRYMLSTEQRFDVIIAEIFHPSRDGAGALYTVEHYQEVRKKLNPNGLFCQWLPLFQLDIATFQSILRSFLKVFPNAQLHLGHFSLKQPILCLVGTQSIHKISPNWLASKVTQVALQQQLVESRLNSDLALLGGFLASGETLNILAGKGLVNTDDHPFITYQAPNFVYQAPQPPAHRLMEMLAILPLPKGEQVTNDRDFAVALEKYWQARALFLQAGEQVSQSDNVMEILLKTYPQLITAIKTSADFEPAYRALMGMATQIYPINRKVALNLLNELDEAAPMFNDARRLREQLK